MRKRNGPIKDLLPLRFMAIPMTDKEKIISDIQERESDLANLTAMYNLHTDKNRAMKIVICLSDNNIIEHWMDNNASLWSPIYSEMGLIEKEIKELKEKLAELEAAEKAKEEQSIGGPGPVSEIPITENQEEELNVQAPEPSKENFNIDDFPL